MTKSDRRDALVGEVLDARYRIERRVARGGMSTVYLGTDLKLRRQVALKVLHPHMADTPESVEKFEAEAIAAARLSDPNVVNVYDQGVDGSEAYLVMEYVPGVTLRDILKTQGVMTPRVALDVIAAILSGLAAAHSAHLVHRDIKPENVLISADGRIKLADFGLSRAASEHTSTGGLVGTVAYVSPELVTGRGADERTDIYACGVLLYELLTGQQPYYGDTTWEVAMRHVNERVPAPSGHLQELNETVDHLVEWSTEPDPDDRPPHAGDFLREVRQTRSRLAPNDLDLGEEPVTLEELVVATQNVLARTNPQAYDAPAAPEEGPSPDAEGNDSDEEEPTTFVGVPPSEGTSVFSAAPPASNTARVPEGGPERHDLRLPSDTQSQDIQATPEQLDQPGSREDSTPHGPQAPTEMEHASSAGQGPPPPTGPRTGRAARKPSESVTRPGVKRRAWMIGMVVVIIALLGGGSAWWFGAGPGAEMVVPQLKNHTTNSAETALEDSGTHATRSTAYSPTVAKGRVIRTKPAAGQTVRRYHGVNLVVSRGPRMLEAPNLTGLEEDRVKEQLNETKLKLGEVSQRHDEAKAGTVIEQSVDVGESVAEGTEVDVVLSSGPAPVDVPRVTGRSSSDARDLLKAAGFEVEYGSSEYSDAFKEGEVMRTEPKGGDAVERGSKITIITSKGPDKVKVPDVKFKKTKEATKILEDADFKVRVDEGTFGSVLNNVVKQSPKAGEKVKRGSTITLGVV